MAKTAIMYCNMYYNYIVLFCDTVVKVIVTRYIEKKVSL